MASKQYEDKHRNDPPVKVTRLPLTATCISCGAELGQAHASNCEFS